MYRKEQGHKQACEGHVSGPVVPDASLLPCTSRDWVVPPLHGFCLFKLDIISFSSGWNINFPLSWSIIKVLDVILYCYVIFLKDDFPDCVSLMPS